MLTCLMCSLLSPTIVLVILHHAGPTLGKGLGVVVCHLHHLPVPASGSTKWQHKTAIIAGR